MPSFKDPKTVIFSGIFMKSGERTLNGRVYSRECLQKMVADFNKRKKEDKLHMVGDEVYITHAYLGNCSVGDS